MIPEANAEKQQHKHLKKKKEKSFFLPPLRIICLEYHHNQQVL